MLDAVKIVQRPVIEVNITNIHKREEPYRHSLISRAATAVICGLGADGYLVALHAMAVALRKTSPSPRGRHASATPQRTPTICGRSGCGRQRERIGARGHRADDAGRGE